MWGKDRKVIEDLTKEVKQLRLLIEKTIAEDKKQIAIINKAIIEEGVKETLQEFNNEVIE